MRIRCAAGAVAGLANFSPFIIKGVHKGPKGPEPALGFFKKKTPGLSQKSGVPRRHVVKQQQAKQKQKLSPNEPGGRANVFFSFYVIIITSTLRFRLRHGYRTLFVYVTLP